MDVSPDEYHARFSTDTWARIEDEVVVWWLSRFGLVRGSVMDVGCGTGWILNHFPVAPTEYIGVDPSPGMLALARRLHPEHQFIPGRATTPPVRITDSYLALWGAWNHVMPDARYFAAREMAAAMRPGGTYAVMVYAERHQDDFVAVDGQSHAPWSREELTRHLQDAGFREVNVREFLRADRPARATPSTEAEYYWRLRTEVVAPELCSGQGRYLIAWGSR